MIMTDSAKPRLSATGLTLAFALAIAGWIVGPVWACPPEKKAKDKKAKTAKVITVPAPAPLPGIAGGDLADPAERHRHRRLDCTAVGPR